MGSFLIGYMEVKYSLLYYVLLILLYQVFQHSYMLQYTVAMHVVSNILCNVHVFGEIKFHKNYFHISSYL